MLTSKLSRSRVTILRHRLGGKITFQPNFIGLHSSFSSDLSRPGKNDKSDEQDEGSRYHLAHQQPPDTVIKRPSREVPVVMRRAA